MSELTRELVILKEALKRYQNLRAVYVDCFDFVVDVQRTVASTPLELERMTDLAYICKESAKVLDDLRKEYQRLHDVLEKLTCALWVRQSETDASPEHNIKGVLATGTPDMKLAVRLPKEGENPEAYKALLTYLGFDELTIQNGLASLHWPKMVDYATALAGEGKPLPPGINPEDQYPIYKLKLHSVNRPEALYRKVDETLKELHSMHEKSEAEQSNKVWETRLTVRQS